MPPTSKEIIKHLLEEALERDPQLHLRHLAELPMRLQELLPDQAKLDLELKGAKWKALPLWLLELPALKHLRLPYGLLDGQPEIVGQLSWLERWETDMFESTTSQPLNGLIYLSRKNGWTADFYMEIWTLWRLHRATSGYIGFREDALAQTLATWDAYPKDVLWQAITSQYQDLPLWALDAITRRCELPTPQSGQKIALVGKFQTPREQLLQWIKDLGLVLSTKIEKADILVLGTDPNDKQQAAVAKSLGAWWTEARLCQVWESQQNNYLLEQSEDGAHWRAKILDLLESYSEDNYHLVLSMLEQGAGCTREWRSYLCLAIEDRWRFKEALRKRCLAYLYPRVSVQLQHHLLGTKYEFGLTGLSMFDDFLIMYAAAGDLCKETMAWYVTRSSKGRVGPSYILACEPMDVVLRFLQRYSEVNNGVIQLVEYLGDKVLPALAVLPQVRGLREVILTNQHFSHLPDWFGDLAELEVLDLSTRADLWKLGQGDALAPLLRLPRLHTLICRKSLPLPDVFYAQMLQKGVKIVSV